MPKNQCLGPKLLRRFAQDYGLSAEDIAVRLIPSPERQTVIRWWKGTRRPDVHHRTQLEQISGGKVLVSSWQTEKELARNAWLKQHPKPASFRERLGLDGANPLDPGGAEAAEEEAAEEAEEIPADIAEADEDPEPSKPTPPKRKKESARVPPPLPKHDHCASADPVVRLSDRHRKRFEVVDSSGKVLLLSNDFCDAKVAMDGGDHPGATSVRCADCKADLARVSATPKGATEGLVRKANRAGFRTLEAEVDL